MPENSIRPIPGIDIWRTHTYPRMAAKKEKIVRFEVGKLYFGNDEKNKAVIFRCNSKSKDLATLEIVNVSNGKAIPTGKKYSGMISIYEGYDWKAEYLKPIPKILIRQKGFSIVFGITAVHKVSDARYPLSRPKTVPAPFGL